MIGLYFALKTLRNIALERLVSTGSVLCHRNYHIVSALGVPLDLHRPRESCSKSNQGSPNLDNHETNIAQMAKATT